MKEKKTIEEVTAYCLVIGDYIARHPSSMADYVGPILSIEETTRRVKSSYRTIDHKRQVVETDVPYFHISFAAGTVRCFGEVTFWRKKQGIAGKKRAA